ncbi:MAG: glycoside hydrolase family 3 [Ktedonobacteraceae bacterium]|nr:glycoside hydrolase family 3 [Ktedonobacteraceae bacterium]
MPTQTEQSLLPVPPHQEPFGGTVPGKGQTPRLHRKHNTSGKVLVLVILVFLVVLLGSDAQQVTARPVKKVTPRVLLATGPFIQPPFEPDQVNQLHHLLQYVSHQQQINAYLSHMTLDQKLGQFFMVQYWGYTYSADLETMLHDQYAGGVIMYGAQMNTFKQTKNDIAHMQQKAWMPLLISTDEEGGFVQRIMNIYGNRPGALETYQTGNIANAARLGHSIAHDLKALGINTDLAPDVDVPVVMGPDQYMRTWGYTPQSVIRWGGTYLQAIQGDDEIGTLKHFPGLGDATTDAHQNLPVVNRSQEQLYSTELAPYKYFAQTKNKLEQPGMIMSTDVMMPALDPKMPGELSHAFITDILRNQFGYNGVVITDALYMLGIANKWSLPQAVVLSIEAGNDMILGVRDSSDLAASVAALKQAIANGDISMARINESVSRIISLKLQYHIWPSMPGS